MLAVVVLVYCLYVVQDWLDMLTHDQVKEANIKSCLGANIYLKQAFTIKSLIRETRPFSTCAENSIVTKN